jgi:hypothetical protein
MGESFQIAFTQGEEIINQIFKKSQEKRDENQG